jgi:hypothetical protein
MFAVLVNQLTQYHQEYQQGRHHEKQHQEEQCKLNHQSYHTSASYTSEELQCARHTSEYPARTGVALLPRNLWLCVLPAPLSLPGVSISALT